MSFNSEVLKAFLELESYMFKAVGIWLTIVLLEYTNHLQFHKYSDINENSTKAVAS